MDIKFRISKRGVPHILVSDGSKTKSICYFSKSGFYRVWDYKSQEKIKDVKIEKGESILLDDLIK
jgi:hypothetical protein